jgi:hypothetical protein
MMLALFGRYFCQQTASHRMFVQMSVSLVFFFFILMTPLCACYFCVAVPPLVNAIIIETFILPTFLTCILEYVYVTFNFTILYICIYFEYRI